MAENSTAVNAVHSNLDNPIPLAERISEGVVLCILCVMALFGNICLWLIVCLSRDLRTLSNYLLLCLSTADILVSVVNMPITVYTILIGQWMFTETTCVGLGMLNMVTFISSVMSLAAISLNRYAAICKPTSFKVYFNRRNTVLVILSVWVLSISLASPPLLGWGRYGYLPGQSFCFCDWSTSVSYTFFMVGVCFGVPCAAMTFCYIKIMREVRASRMRVANFSETSTGTAKNKFLSPDSARKLFTVETQNTDSKPNPPKVAFAEAKCSSNTGSSKDKLEKRNDKNKAFGGNTLKVSESATPRTDYRSRHLKKRRQEEVRLAMSLLVVVLVFVIAWLPFCVTMFWTLFSPGNPPPRPVDMFTLLLGYANSGCNPLIYGLMNRRFKEGFKRLFRCQFRDISRNVSDCPSVLTAPYSRC